ncbi:MAG: DUF1902 domain-containing protein, partial [Methylocystis sp.]
LDKAVEPTDFSFMTAPIKIDAHWDDEAHVWIATSSDAPGLVVEAPSWQLMIDEVRSVLPDLLDLDAACAREVSLTFKAETHLALAAG